MVNATPQPNEIETTASNGDILICKVTGTDYGQTN